MSETIGALISRLQAREQPTKELEEEIKAVLNSESIPSREVERVIGYFTADNYSRGSWPKNIWEEALQFVRARAGESNWSHLLFLTIATSRVAPEDVRDEAVKEYLTGKILLDQVEMLYFGNRFHLYLSGIQQRLLYLFRQSEPI